MAFFFIVALVPILIALGCFLASRGISWKEFLVQVLVQVLVAGVCAGIASCENTSDVEVWNGAVVDKKQVRVSCSHSYPCNCRQSCSSDSKGNQSCTTICDTCYEHSYDYDWNVYTSNSEVIGISRIDRQGTSTPPRWAAVAMGEPTAVEHSYVNYVKGAPGTIFKRQGALEKYEKTLPNYPGDVYDYYRLNRLVSVDVPVDDTKRWNADLEVLNRDIGSAKQVNIIVVLTRDKDRDWYYALEEKWIGSKKNDIVLVVDVDSQGKVVWVETMAWTVDQTFKVKLRDAVLDVGSLDRERIIRALKDNVIVYHKRKPMKDYEYLSSSIVPTTTQWIVSLIIGLLVALSLSWLFHVHDVFGDESSWNIRYRRRNRGYGYTQYGGPG